MSAGRSDPPGVAAAFLSKADALLITAGAGIGVDSGLPDFRGPQGFWNAYPGLRRAGLRFEEVASPETFERDPELAWGFYGHRLALYRSIVPHAGFRILLDFAARLPHGAFVFTSNVHGQFQKAGFAGDRVAEVHGSIHHLQCLEADCESGIWDAADVEPDVEEDRCRLQSLLPRCPACGGVARPNILMFGDWAWRPERSGAQEQRLAKWLRRVQRPVTIEVGSGTRIATVREFSNRLPAPLIRINKTDAQLPSGKKGVSFQLGGLEALEAIAAALDQQRS